MDDAVVNLIVLVIFAVIAGIARLVGRLREKSAQTQAEERRLEKEEAASGGEENKPSGLEALLEALAKAASEGSQAQQAAGEPPPSQMPASETFEVESDMLPGEEFVAPPASEDMLAEREARVAEAAARVRATEEEAHRALEEARKAEAALAATASASPPAEEERSKGEPVVAPTAAPGEPRISLDTVRRGMIWALVFARPRALVPYGADDPAGPLGDRG